MAPRKPAPGRQSYEAARVEQFEARTEADPLGALQPETDAEFSADGKIPRGQESTTRYVERIGRADEARKRGKPGPRRPR